MSDNFIELPHQLAFDFEALGQQLQAEGLSVDSATQLQHHAATIRHLQEQVFLDVGKELLAARALCEHGGWGTFLNSLGMKESTARNLMNVARQFGDASPEISATVADLPPSLQYVIASPSADPVVVGEIIAEVAAGAPVPSVSDVRQRLKPQPQPQPDTEDEESDEDEIGVYTPISPVTPLSAAPVASKPPSLPSAPQPLTVEGGFEQQSRKLQAAKLLIVRAMLAQLEHETIQPVQIEPSIVEQAAKSLLANPAIASAAAMLSLNVK